MFIGQYNSTVQPHRLDNIFSVPTLNDHTAQPAFLNSVCQQHPHLNHVKFPHLSSYTGSLLIGVDPYDVICSCGVIHGPPKTPKALHTLLGWTIVGHSSHQLPTTAQVLLVRTPTMDDERFQQIHSWMRQDFDGVSSTKTVFQPTIAALRSFSIQQQQKSKVATKSDFCRKKTSTYQIICGLPNVNFPRTTFGKKYPKKQSMTTLPDNTSFKCSQTTQLSRKGVFHTIQLPTSTSLERFAE